MSDAAKPNAGGIENLKWNFVMGLIHGVMMTAGRAFGNPNTILPVFLSNFTESKAIIGLSSTIMGNMGGIGVVLPQLFVASRLESRAHKKPIMIVAITIRALCWGVLALTTYLFAARYPGLMVFLLFSLLTVFTLMAGIAVIPYYDIWGKSIPSTLRGRFFGHRQLWGGALAVGSGFIAKWVLGNESIPFPTNFALLFFLAFAFLAAAYLALGSVREPVEEVHGSQRTFARFLSKAVGILKSDPNYRRFLLVQVLAGGSGLALPFYVLYARETLNVRLEIVGIFLSAQMLGNVLSNLAWAHLSDFVGNRRVIQVSCFVALLVPLIAIITPPSMPYLFVVLFVFAGSFIAGRMIGRGNFLLDIAPPKERPAYISLNGTLSFPIVVFPLIGGILVERLSYNFLFVLTLFVVLAGFLLSLGLREPRARREEDQ
jgi:MFS family permease